MSIRPVDMQIMVPRTAELGKTQHSEINRHDVLQQQFSERMEKQTALIGHQIQESNKSEKMTINSDEESKKNNQKYKKQKKRAKSDKDTEEKKEKTNTSMFDMRI